jgi:Zn-dependent M28 family amino/carboxypeptidase
MTARARAAALSVAIATATGAVVNGAAGASETANASRWWAHVRFLSDDSLQGREAGHEGYTRAADYVAEAWRKAGLEPAYAGRFLQPVALKARQIDESRSSLALVRDGRVEALTLGEDANFSLRIDPALDVDAPLVFTGHGLHVPDSGINDFEGLNLKGAVAVYFSTPSGSLPAPLEAHFGSYPERWRMLRAAGAIGAITVPGTGRLEVPWSRFTLARLQPQMSLADPALDEYPGQQIAVTMNPDKADVLFAGSGHTLAELAARDQAGQPLPRFTLPARVKATIAVNRSTVESPNVAAVLRGADPALRGEAVVLSAHLDHVGIGDPVAGDRIYNGTMDNASGVAAILEVAARLRESGYRPARSIVFAAFTAEELGELGSRYLVEHPPEGLRIVADVNTDMFLPLFPLRTLMVLGLDESDLAGDIRAVARDLHLAIQGDPEPQRNRFTRSDQYSFVRAGIPALAMKVGYDPNTPEAAIALQWTAERYHAPSDDVSQPVDMKAATDFVNVIHQLALRIANRAGRPNWNDNSFFKRFGR